MNKKKKIIFHINSTDSYYGEFHENTKIRMIKSYFRDVSHYNKFNLIFNGEICINDDISIKEMIRGSYSYEIFLKVSFQNLNDISSVNYFSENNNNYENYGSIPISRDFGTLTRSSLSQAKSMKINCHPGIGNTNNLPLPINNSLNIKSYEDMVKEISLLSSEKKELERQVIELREENAIISNRANEANTKMIALQKCCENLSVENVNSNNIIEKMKYEYQQLEKSNNIIVEKLKIIGGNQGRKYNISNILPTSRSSTKNENLSVDTNLLYQKKSSIEIDKSSDYKKTNSSYIDTQNQNSSLGINVKVKKSNYEKEKDKESKIKVNSVENGASVKAAVTDSKFINYFSAFVKNKSKEEKKQPESFPVSSIKKRSFSSNTLSNSNNNNNNKNYENGYISVDNKNDNIITINLNDDCYSVEKLKKVNSKIFKPRTMYYKYLRN